MDKQQDPITGNYIQYPVINHNAKEKSYLKKYTQKKKYLNLCSMEQLMGEVYEVKTFKVIVSYKSSQEL